MAGWQITCPVQAMCLQQKLNKKSDFIECLRYLTSLSGTSASNASTTCLSNTIDTEGHEPNVITGMKLQNALNRRAFSAFQCEAGIRWRLAGDGPGNRLPDTANLQGIAAPAMLQR
eukprot:2550590-Prymnesium_polylepis.1